MSYTNHTTNYNLPQYIGTDKPTYLGDFNTAMGAIDTQMKANADAATTAGTTATAASNAIGALANLTTTDKTSVVNAINEVDTNADTAASAASTAASTALAAKTTADGLENYFTITQNAKISPTVTGGTVGNINDLYYALNANGTFGKVYGRVRVTASASSVTVKLPISPLANPTTAYTIAAGCWWSDSNSAGLQIVNARDITVNTDHSISISFTNIQVNDSITIWLPPCCYFFTNFGDQPSPDA